MTAIAKVALTSTTASYEYVPDYFVCTLSDATVSGAFSSDQRLIEAILFAQLGLSRQSLSAALRQLEFERLVHNSPQNEPLVAGINWKETQEISQVILDSCRNQPNSDVLS